MKTIESIIPDIPQVNKEPLLKKLERYMGLLEEQNKSLFILIHNLHVGLQAYQREKTILVDVYNMLLETNTTIIATIEPGQSQKGIFYESILLYPMTIHDKDALQERVQDLTKDPVKKQIIDAKGNTINGVPFGPFESYL